MIATENLAGMSNHQIALERKHILERKRINARFAGEADSMTGKMFLERRREMLEDIRKEYNFVKIVGTPPQDALMRFLTLQVRERLIAEDISAVENVAETSKRLDAELKQCDDSLRKREEDSIASR